MFLLVFFSCHKHRSVLLAYLRRALLASRFTFCFINSSRAALPFIFILDRRANASCFSFSFVFLFLL